MAIELIIKVSEEDYERLKEYEKAPFNSLTSRAYEAIANGTPLPKEHGDLIDVSELEEIYLNDESLEDIQDAIFAIKRVTPIIKADKAESEGK